MFLFSHISCFFDAVIHQLHLFKNIRIFFWHIFLAYSVWPISSVWVFGSLCAFISIALSLSRGLLGIICMAYFLYGVWLIPTSRLLRSKHSLCRDYHWAFLNEPIHLRLDLHNACYTIQDHTSFQDLDQAITHLRRV